MNPSLSKLVASLREELQQYGEMLARLDDQQAAVIHREPDQVLGAASALQSQSAVVRQARRGREDAQRAVAVNLGLDESVAFAQMLPLMPEPFRPLLSALVQENNELLVRVRQRARQNHVLLAKSVEMMQEMLDSLFSTGRSPVYGETGALFARAVSSQPMYEAVG
jgi:flagellar biosynthesis/type III secretory pathway chaperone